MIGGRGAGSAAIVAALALALFGLAPPAHAQDERPTGFPLSADEDAHGAVTVSAVYTADLRSNVAGGIARGVRYLDITDDLLDPLTKTVRKTYLGPDPHAAHLQHQPVSALWAKKLYMLLAIDNTVTDAATAIYGR